MKTLLIKCEIIVDRIPNHESDYQYALGVVEEVNNLLMREMNDIQPQILEVDEDDVVLMED